MNPNPNPSNSAMDQKFPTYITVINSISCYQNNETLVKPAVFVINLKSSIYADIYYFSNVLGKLKNLG